MKHRNFRIAWSVAWGVVVVSLCVLWVRSYWRVDYICLDGAPARVIRSLAGSIEYEKNGFEPFDKGDNRWKVGSDKLEPATYRQTTFGFAFEKTWVSNRVMIPYWCAVTILPVIAAIPWLRWSTRFSLRTLLLATALVAVGLGLAVWASGRVQ